MGGGVSNNFKLNNFRSVGDSGKVDKVGVGGPQAGQAGEAGAAAGAQGVAADVPKIVSQAAQHLTAAADSFKSLAPLNPFSSQAPKLMQAVADGFKALNDAFSEWKQAVPGQGGGIDEAIKSWGESIREQAEMDKKASIEKDLLNRPIQDDQIKADELRKSGL